MTENNVNFNNYATTKKSDVIILDYLFYFFIVMPELGPGGIPKVVSTPRLSRKS